MASPSREAQDAFINRRVGLEHYSNTVVEKVLRHLSDMEADVTNALLRGGNIRTMNDLRTKLAVIHDLQREGEAVIKGLVEESFAGAALSEAEFLRDYYARGGGLDELFDYPSAATLVASALSKPLGNKHLQSWIRKLTDDQIKEVDRQIRIGVSLGETVPQIIARTQGTVGAAGQDSIWARSKRSAEAFVRTGVQHVSNQAHASFMEINSEVFHAYVHVSVLDNRTSAICRSLAGHVYETYEDVQWPPLHPNCRSTIIGVPKGTSPKSMQFDDFPTWLGRQSKERATEILGPARAKLYFDGRLKPTRFFNNGRKVTLDQLRAEDKAAWKRAFKE